MAALEEQLASELNDWKRGCGDSLPDFVRLNLSDPLPFIFPSAFAFNSFYKPFHIPATKLHIRVAKPDNAAALFSLFS